MKMISVIIPVYNAEKYLFESLQSVLRQTYKDFELICVDDCSMDDTRKILTDFQKKDDRIRILSNKERLGAAGARNRGLKESRGKYVIFLDGDDIFEEELLEKTYDTMEKHDVDMVMFDYMHVTGNDIYTKKKALHPVNFQEKYCRHPFSVKDFVPEDFPNWSDSVCDKMFKRKFICDNHITFQNLPSYNDVYFSKMTTYCASKIIWLDDCRIMVYARDHTNLSRISSAREPMCAYYAMERLGMELKVRNRMNDLAEHFYYRMSLMMLHVLRNEKSEERKRDFYSFLHDKGIVKCIEYGKERYDQIDLYTQYLLESFKNEAYESRWFDTPYTYVQVYLRKSGKVIDRFVADQLRKDKTVMIWGIGINGTSLLKHLNAHGIKVSAVADAEEKKQGCLVEGYKIQDPHFAFNKMDYVITTSDTVYQEAVILSKGTNTSVINAFELLAGEERI